MSGAACMTFDQGHVMPGPNAPVVASGKRTAIVNGNPALRGSTLQQMDGGITAPAVEPARAMARGRNDMWVTTHDTLY